jgi:hypothetical protein
MRGKGRPFQTGQIANPRGRPKGCKDRLPRGFMRRVYETALKRKEKDVVAFIERMLVDHKQGLQAHELAAKLMKEIGSAQDLASILKPTTIIIRTNINPLAMAHQPIAVEGQVLEQRRLPPRRQGRDDSMSGGS